MEVDEVLCHSPWYPKYLQLLLPIEFTISALFVEQPMATARVSEGTATTLPVNISTNALGNSGLVLVKS